MHKLMPSFLGARQGPKEVGGREEKRGRVCSCSLDASLEVIESLETDRQKRNGTEKLGDLSPRSTLTRH